MKGATKLAVFLPVVLLAACDQGGPTAADLNATVTGPGPIVGTSATPSPEEIDVCKRGPAGDVVFTLAQTGPDPANPLSDDGADGSATIAAGTCERVAFNGGDRDTVIVTETVPAGQQLDSIIRQQLTPAGTTTTKFTGTNSVRALITGGGTAGEGAVITFYNSLIPVEVCTYTKGWYQNNNGKPTVIAVDGRTIGQAQAIFEASPGQPGGVTWGVDNKPNNLLNLYQQFLAALQNLGGDANEDNGPTAVDNAIDAVQAGTGGTVLNITTNLTNGQISALIEVLSAFNEGKFAGFPHCEDEVLN